MGEADRIELRGLQLTAVVGVLPEERDRAQPLEIDLDLEVDLSAAGLSDSLGHTVDYSAACEVASAVVATAEPLLLERLATLVADALLSLDQRIDSVTVSIRKLRPPIPLALTSCGVRLVRSSRADTR